MFGWKLLDFSSTFTSATSHVDIISHEYVPSPVTSVEWSANQCFVPTQLDSNLYYIVAANRAHPTLSAHWALIVVARIHINDLNRLAWIHCMSLWPNDLLNILHRQIQDLAPYQPTDGCDALHLWKCFEKKKFNLDLRPKNKEIDCPLFGTSPQSVSLSPKFYFFGFFLFFHSNSFFIFFFLRFWIERYFF